MRTFLMLTVIFILAVGSLIAAVPTTMNYQGFLTDNVGDPVADDSYSVVFTIYDAAASGSSVWTETQMVSTTNGFFAVMLGSVSPIINTVFSGPTRYLAIEVSGDPELSPRTALISVPFSFRSATSDSANTITDGAINLADIGQNGATSNQILKWNGSAWVVTTDESSSSAGWTDDGSVLRLDAVEDSVGIGTATPIAKLEVIGDVRIQGKSNIGFGNTNTGTNASVMGTNSNANGGFSTVGGGQDNLSSGINSTISGGRNNTASGNNSIVGGGLNNAAIGNGSTVSGGSLSSSEGINTVVAGGEDNSAIGNHSSIGGGLKNSGLGNGSTVSGGSLNSSKGVNAVVAGGQENAAIGDHSSIGGGLSDSAAGEYSTISGGVNNTTTNLATSSVIAGGEDNAAIGNHSSIGGGLSDTASGNYSTVGGGSFNSSNGINAVVAGGEENTAIGNHSSIGGGLNNIGIGHGSTVGGGSINSSSGNNAVISGGQLNEAQGEYSAIAGGQSNVASGSYSTVLGGQLNTASGNYSFAGGRKAKALNNGSFVWGDNTDAIITSTGDNEFKVRARGGTYFYTNSNLTAGVRLPNGASAWVAVSDSTLKENIQEVDGEEILEKISELEITRWNYEAQDKSIQHIGPMAQDFYRIFGVGDDDISISTLDPDGISLAAIKALIEKNKNLEVSNEELTNRLDRLEELIEKLSNK